MPISRIPGVGLETTGTASVTTFLRGDNTWSSTMTSGTAVTASGTSVDFTGIPAGVKRITVMFNGVSTNGTSPLLIQLGDSGGIENTGYVSSATNTGASSLGSAAFTTGFGIQQSTTAANTACGVATIANVTGNTWSHSCNLGYTSTGLSLSGGAKTLSAALDRVRITTVNGTDTFDAGTINLLWE